MANDDHLPFPICCPTNPDHLSPHVLDYFDVDSIRVTSLVNGETRILPVRKSQVETVKAGLMTLSEIMALDGLKQIEPYD